MNKPALLDVNVLIALLDPRHQFCDPSRAWLKENRRHGWATCPIVENGCLRIMSRPGYPFPGLTAARVAELLRELLTMEGHRFWPDSATILDSQHISLAEVASTHLTDLYLLNLAISNRGRLATFDRSIPWRAVAGAAPEDVVVLSAR